MYWLDLIMVITREFGKADDGHLGRTKVGCGLKKAIMYTNEMHSPHCENNLSLRLLHPSRPALRQCC